jgi:hypothetical protein
VDRKGKEKRRYLGKVANALLPCFEAKIREENDFGSSVAVARGFPIVAGGRGGVY